MHGRFHESCRVALPIHRGLHGSGSTQQAYSWHLSLAFLALVRSDLLHRSKSQQVLQNFLHQSSDSCFQQNFRCNSLIMVASNDQSDTDASREHLARTRSQCVWKIRVDCMLHFEHLPAHVFFKKSSSDKCSKETER